MYQHLKSDKIGFIQEDDDLDMTNNLNQSTSDTWKSVTLEWSKVQPDKSNAKNKNSYDKVKSRIKILNNCK